MNSELEEALTSVRIGNHERAKAHLKASGIEIPRGYVDERPTTMEDVERLRAVTLAAEIAEHDGAYDRAKAYLAPFQEAITPTLEEEARAQTPDVVFSSRNLRWQIVRQELYYLWQLSVASYRAGEYQESRRQLQIALRLAEKLRPDAEGLLTQLYYGAAKLAFHESDFSRSIEMYRASLSKAAERISERQHRSQVRPVDRSAARYNIGKALALGLGQCMREQGRLAEARTVVIAGRLLLDLTPDTVLRHHARMLLGSIERGSAGEDNVELLTSARENLNACVAFFDEHGGDPWFRAHYELALAMMQQRQTAEARREITTMLHKAQTVRPPKAKWIANAQIALSRIERRAGNHVSAVAAARTGLQVASCAMIDRIARRARTTLAIALGDMAMSNNPIEIDRLDEVESELKNARRALDDGDTRNQVMLLLVGARVRIARGDMAEAQRQYDDYRKIGRSVEGGRVREMAEEVRRALERGTTLFCAPVDQPEADFDYARNIAAFEQYLLQKVQRVMPNARPGALAGKLRMSKKSLKSLERRVVDAGSSRSDTHGEFTLEATASNRADPAC